MSSALLRSARLLRPQFQSVRNMSGHSIEEAIAETDKWKKISYAFLPVVGLVGTYVMYDHFAHHKHYHQVKYPFIGKRDKPMPWALAGGTDCALFDYKCSAALKAAAEH